MDFWKPANVQTEMVSVDGCAMGRCPDGVFMVHRVTPKLAISSLVVPQWQDGPPTEGQMAAWDYWLLDVSNDDASFFVYGWCRYWLFGAIGIQSWCIASDRILRSTPIQPYFKHSALCIPLSVAGPK